MLLQIILDLPAQDHVGRELRRFRPARAHIRQGVRPGRAIATGTVAVAGELATDRRRAAAQPPSDRAHRLTTRARDRSPHVLRTSNTDPSNSARDAGVSLPPRGATECLARDRSPPRP